MRNKTRFTPKACVWYGLGQAERHMKTTLQCNRGSEGVRVQISIEGVLSTYSLKVNVLGYPESMSSNFTVNIFAIDIFVPGIFPT